MPARTFARHLFLAGLGAGITLTWLVAVLLARAGANPLAAYNAAFAVVFGLYLVATAYVVRRGAANRRPAPLLLILAFALLPRLVLLTSWPALSDDLYRYIWDGKVQAAGIDPYRYPPSAPELATLRDPLWTPINQKAQRTPYPPTAELVFAAVYRLAPDSVKAQQVAATGADLLAIGALLLLLTRLGLPRERVLLYAWHPLPMLHFAHSAHNDALMIAALLLALALAHPDHVPGAGAFRRAGSGLALAVAALVKLIPALLVPLLIRRWRVVGTLAFGAGVLALAAPYRFAWRGLLSGLGTEAGQAVFNDSVHYVLVRLAARLTTHAATLTGLLTAGLLGATAVALAWRGGASGRDLARNTAILLGLALLLNAVVEPWYLTWLLPFIALFLGAGLAEASGSGERRASRAVWWGWLWLSGAVQLTDLTYLGPQATRWWPLIRAVEYGPLALLLVWAGIQHLRAWRHRAR